MTILLMIFVYGKKDVKPGIKPGVGGVNYFRKQIVDDVEYRNLYGKKT